jgi:hypothetical protein
MNYIGNPNKCLSFLYLECDQRVSKFVQLFRRVKINLVDLLLSSRKAPEVFRSFKQMQSIDLYQNLCYFAFP